ncbi:hypothetical protein A3860_07605 [Niastella vici]|uniref:Uncharacterized protein n=1 Tax=Niastella vici TaxID=1703345 RepID=A0A1V9FIS6_9BACT|nr:hypothetical protein A3860_07605 [Niastella vici]
MAILLFFIALQVLMLTNKVIDPHLTTERLATKQLFYLIKFKVVGFSSGTENRDLPVYSKENETV